MDSQIVLKKEIPMANDADNKEYGAKSIRVMEGLQAVRKRL